MNSILSSLLSTSKFSVSDATTGATLWNGLKVASVEIDETAANSQYPMDTQQLSNQEVIYTLLAADISTTKIETPTHMRIEAIAPDISTLENVLATFADETAIIDVTTKGVICSSMVVVSVIVEQSPSMISAAKLLISLEQAIPPDSSSWDPAQSGDSDTNGVRIQSLPSVSTTVTTLIGRASSLF